MFHAVSIVYCVRQNYVTYRKVQPLAEALARQFFPYLVEEILCSA
jgi:hypothetical protein